jgi:hypothetical protein
MTKIDDLCKGFPEEFSQYCTYCRTLKFEDKPDYTYLRSLFKNLFKSLGYEVDYNFDWIQKKDAGKA